MRNNYRTNNNSTDKDYKSKNSDGTLIRKEIKIIDIWRIKDKGKYNTINNGRGVSKNNLKYLLYIPKIHLSLF